MLFEIARGRTGAGVTIAQFDVARIGSGCKSGGQGTTL
jgi:hypothetical protein